MHLHNSIRTLNTHILRNRLVHVDRAMNCSEYELYELCACITHIIRMRVYFDYLNPKKTRPTLLKSLFLALRAPK